MPCPIPPCPPKSLKGTFFPSFSFYVFVFDCAGSSLLCGLFSSCGEQGLLSRCGARDLGHMGFSNCSSWGLEHRLSSSGKWALLLWGLWNIPRPEIKSVTPATAGRFFTTGPPVLCTWINSLNPDNSPGRVEFFE